MELLDRGTCYRALAARDRRFDGKFFVGVVSTGIYCRPICPARTAKFENCRFFANAAAAEENGFRACLRCRPEISPQLGGWRGTSLTVRRALGLIAAGFLDEKDASVDTLAARLGMGERQLRRLFREHLGTSPVQVAQTRRVLFAKQLLHETGLPVTEIAMASGFGSLRRFNEVFQELYRRPPSELRRPRTRPLTPGITLRITYQPPYDWEAMLAFLHARAVEGVETVRGKSYLRTFSIGRAQGVVEVANDPERNALQVKIQDGSLPVLPEILLRVRHSFDLYADVAQIAAHLGQDPALAAHIAKRPGLRAPGGWDGFELAIRAVLGQQITVEAARRLTGKLVKICGKRLEGADREFPSCIFPDAQAVAAADLAGLGMPQSRKNALHTLARAAASNERLFDPAASVEEAVERLRAIPGIGQWTAQYIALRALREPDAFPASDAAILRAGKRLTGEPVNAGQMLERAEMWRPWRAYAAQHLWALQGGENARREI